MVNSPIPDTSKGGLRKIECDLPRGPIRSRRKRHLMWSAVIWCDLMWSAVIWCDLMWSAVIWCDPYVPRGPIRNWQVYLPRVSWDQLRAATWTNKNMPRVSCGPVKTCHVDQLDHGARGGGAQKRQKQRNTSRYSLSAFSTFLRMTGL